ncbi:hypothetical protein STRTUCAR8_00008 [Streptomyces turgidiscabies Car8]|uniref:Uncharacterized protein n=1 Tax=Streptomyces turgidiscabies (strain Car8) TaxID=698760 RepID=L7EU81_STRT8|nr:hypothetical protein STRTUCAR8_00008 [Streptomyces turgidiscabies Car8]
MGAVTIPRHLWRAASCCDWMKQDGRGSCRGVGLRLAGIDMSAR